MIKIAHDLAKAFLIDNTKTGERTTLYKSPDMFYSNNFTKIILLCQLKHIFKARDIANDFGIPVMFLKMSGNTLIETYTLNNIDNDTITDFRNHFWGWPLKDGESQNNTQKAVIQEIVNLFEEK